METNRKTGMDDWDGNNRRQKSFWNGTATKILMLFVGLLVFLGGYLFTEVTNAPKVYATQVYVDSIGNRIDGSLQAIRTEISSINNYLRGNK